MMIHKEIVNLFEGNLNKCYLVSVFGALGFVIRLTLFSHTDISFV